MAVTQWVRALKRGDTSDIEDFRLTHRLGVARGILRSVGIEPTFPEHSEKCIKHPDNRARRCVGYEYSCDDPACIAGRWSHNAAKWPEWVDDSIFEAAMELADRVQTKRGEHNRSEAYRAKEERAKAEREAVAS